MKRGFTIVELLTVLTILALLTAAMVAAARKVMIAADIARATAETRELVNSILSYENISKDYELPTCEAKEVTLQNFDWLFSEGGSSEDGQKSTAIIKAALKNGTMYDPWGNPYLISIVSGKATIDERILKDLSTSLFIPNFYRLTTDEMGASK